MSERWRPISRCLPVLLLSCLILGASPPDSTGPYGASVLKDVMVPMRDGVRLATDVYLPTENGAVLDGRHPIILTRTPYDKNGSESAGRYYASHGYVFVAQDTRGRYNSEGVWHMLDDDGRDGFDACAWIGKQPWSNGKIGTIGTSYVGGTQHAIALEKAPELVTSIPVDAMSNLGYQSMRNGGAFELRFWNWIFRGTAVNGSRQSRDPATKEMLQEMADNRHHYLLNLPLRKGTTPLKIATEYEDWLVEGMKRGANDEYWVQNNIVDQPQLYKDMPLYLVGGWYDSWGGNTTRNYRILDEAKRGPIYMIMGPWIHGRQGSFAHGQVSFGEDAAIADPLAWRLTWYDHWLKGKEDTLGKAEPFRTRVRIFVMGTGDETKDGDGYKNHGGYWRDENEWPLARTRYTNYYFHPGGALSTDEPGARDGSTSFEFDPHNPVPTIGGNISSGTGILLQGAWDQRGGDHIWNWKIPIPLSARNDVVVFQTPPLEEDVEVTGEIELKLWASSSALDTDFTAKLVDVHPSTPDFPGGFDMNLADGIIRGSLSGLLEKRDADGARCGVRVDGQALPDIERFQEGSSHPG